MNHITLPTQGHAEYNIIGVSVQYMSHAGAIVVTANPGIQKGEMQSFIIGLQQSEKMEPMTRLNRKKVEAAGEAAKQQIAAKSGPAWNAVQKCLDKEGMTLVS